MNEVGIYTPYLLLLNCKPSEWRYYTSARGAGHSSTDWIQCCEWYSNDATLTSTSTHVDMITCSGSLAYTRTQARGRGGIRDGGDVCVHSIGIVFHEWMAFGFVSDCGRSMQNENEWYCPKSEGMPLLRNKYHNIMCYLLYIVQRVQYLPPLVWSITPECLGMWFDKQSRFCDLLSYFLSIIWMKTNAEWRKSIK